MWWLQEVGSRLCQSSPIIQPIFLCRFPSQRTSLCHSSISCQQAVGEKSGRGSGPGGSGVGNRCGGTGKVGKGEGAVWVEWWRDEDRVRGRAHNWTPATAPASPPVFPGPSPAPAPVPSPQG